MKTDKILRMRMSTWKRLRKCFPGKKGETGVAYINRLSKQLEDLEYANLEFY